MFPKKLALIDDDREYSEFLSQFLRDQGVAVDGLPHTLLATFTTTLLPIIPQIEDYECAICGDVAFKPIKLDCGHRFCVRCLITMQKRGQDACPHCRQPVVLGASARNLDHAMQEYLNLWFPKEVKAKDKLNRTLQAKEELEAMGLSDHRCVVQ